MLDFVMTVVLLYAAVECLPMDLICDLGYDIGTCSHGGAYIEPIFLAKASHTFFFAKLLKI
jgi:hypothetical protein